MKTFIALFSLIAAFNSFGAEASPCKNEAHVAALEAYTAKFGESMIFSKSKFKPVIEGKNIIHMIQILDSERGSNDILTVTMDRFNCNVISID